MYISYNPVNNFLYINMRINVYVYKLIFTYIFPESCNTS